MAQEQIPHKTKKIKVPKMVNGIETMVEIEVEDTGGPSWGPKNGHALLNHTLRRVDGPAKVKGVARYTHDVRLPGMLYGRILHSAYASAEVTSVDLSAAQRLPGVKAVLDLGNRQMKNQGDPIAAVAAVTPEIAEDAIRAIKVTYKQLPHAVTLEQAMRPDAPKIFKNGNVGTGEKQGDPDKAAEALKHCDIVLERTFEVTMQHHACLETHGMTVDYTGGDSATVYASTQGAFTVPDDAAKALDLKASNVNCIVEYMGGGFGSKFGLDLPGQIACQLSKATKLPVKLMLTRVDEFLMAGNRPGALQKIRAGVSKEGKLLAMVAEQYQDGGVDDGGLAGLPYIYNVETAYDINSLVHTNKDAACAMRGPGHVQASFAMESLMDDLAAALGMDPIEFRKQNLSDPAYHRQLDTGAKAIGWDKRPRVPGGGKGYGPEGALKRGWGCGLSTWGGGGQAECQVDVFIKSDGAVAVQVGTQDLGTGTRTYMAAIVAEELGLPLDAVETRIGNTRYGRANSSGGSTTTASLAPAVKTAAYKARQLLFQKVAPLLGAKPDDLTAWQGKIFAQTNPDKSLTWKQACAGLGASGLTAHGEWQAQLQGDGVHGAQFAEVEVDTGTGQVRVIKMVGVQDCGLALNRRGVESQLNGGMIQALGYALLESHVVDADLGLMLNASMDEYKLPGCLEMPELIPIIDDGDTREVPIGMAEPAAIPGAGAIANAVFNACGVRVRSLPITPDKVLKDRRT